jgi:hypothetical protein
MSTDTLVSVSPSLHHHSSLGRGMATDENIYERQSTGPQSIYYSSGSYLITRNNNNHGH